MSEQGHPTKAGKLSAICGFPNAAFISFTGAPLFKHDHLTRCIFGTYVSRDSFKRSEQDCDTVKLIY
jgi:type I restriction enzyme R subunit